LKALGSTIELLLHNSQADLTLQLNLVFKQFACQFMMLDSNQRTSKGTDLQFASL
jgi:hypothetical protein